MDIAGNLVSTIAGGIAGLVGGAFRALGDAVQGVVQAFQSVLPGLWLPVVAFVVVVIVGWSLIKR